jgi:hypothetical protein
MADTAIQMWVRVQGHRTIRLISPVRRIRERIDHAAFHIIDREAVLEQRLVLERPDGELAAGEHGTACHGRMVGNRRWVVVLYGQCPSLFGHAPVKP